MTDDDVAYDTCLTRTKVDGHHRSVLSNKVNLLILISWLYFDTWLGHFEASVVHTFGQLDHCIFISHVECLSDAPYRAIHLVNNDSFDWFDLDLLNFLYIISPYL